VYVKVRVHPGAKAEKVTEKPDGSLEIWTRAPAERGLANKRVMEVVRERAGNPPGGVRLVSGHTSPSKIVRVGK
jgi:uncharacterized protein YggU (UPF0235/DUF167 family)